MSSCPAINSLSMSREGRTALQEIQSKMKASKYLQLGLTSGVLLLVLYEDKPIPQIFNVNMTDWLSLGKAIQGIPNLAQEQIKQIAMDMYIKTGGGDEYKFWKAVYYLCMFK